MIKPRKAFLALAGALLVGGCATGGYYEPYGYGPGYGYSYYPHDYYYYGPTYGYFSYGQSWHGHHDGHRDGRGDWRHRRPPRDDAGVVVPPNPPMPSRDDPGIVTPAPNSRHHSPG